ncbi:MAG: phosphatidylinositol mannoside acyltransferase [Acidimicrobiales bacterium]
MSRVTRSPRPAAADPASAPLPGTGRGAYLTYRLLGGGLQVLPRPAAAGLATIAGLLMTELSPAKRGVVKENLRRVLGPSATEAELDRATREAFDSYAHYWVEGARLATITPAEVMRRFVADGMDHVEEALGAGTGAVMVLPHLGSWEIGGYYLTLMGTPMTTVAEPIDPPELFEWFCSQREQFGLRILPLSPESPAQLIRALRESKLVGLIADRDIQGNGVEVEFFGETATLPAGPAVLSLRTGAPLLPTGVFQEPAGMYRGIIRAPIAFERAGRFRHDVVALTQLIAQELETLIKRAPTQWHMFQPVWPEGRAAADAGAAGVSGGPGAPS